MVLRREGDTVNFLGLEITKISRGFEVENSADLVELFLNLYALENSKPTANPRQQFPLEGHDYSNFRTAVGKLIFMAPWRPDMQFAIQQLSTQVLNPKTESKRAVKQFRRYFKGTRHTSLRLEPRGMVQKGLLELVGRSDSDCGCGSATRQSATGTQNSSRNFIATFQFVSRWIQTRQDTFHSVGPGGLKHNEIRCFAIQQ